jgi:hypothetical protein
MEGIAVFWHGPLFPLTFSLLVKRVGKVERDGMEVGSRDLGRVGGDHWYLDGVSAGGGAEWKWEGTPQKRKP